MNTQNTDMSMNIDVAQMNCINWVEIPTKNIDRAKRFYGEVFRMPLTDTENVPGDVKMSTFPMRTDVEGAPGALVQGEGIVPSQVGATIYFRCQDVAEELRRAEQNGGRVILRKTSVGKNGFIAQFIDCEGNRIGLHSQR